MPLISLRIEPPPTHQAALRILKNKKTGAMFVGKMAKSSAKKWGVEFTALLREAKSKFQVKTYEGATRVGIVFVYPHTKQSAKQGHSIPKVTRPDVDNLAKSVLDCMVDAGWLKDDNLIVELILKKIHSETAQVVIDIDDYVE
jgi:Holliday junction resolvase RusA-like endonuclease